MSSRPAYVHGRFQASHYIVRPPSEEKESFVQSSNNTGSETENEKGYDPLICIWSQNDHLKVLKSLMKCGNDRNASCPGDGWTYQAKASTCWLLQNIGSTQPGLCFPVCAFQCSVNTFVDQSHWFYQWATQEEIDCF